MELSGPRNQGLLHESSGGQLLNFLKIAQSATLLSLKVDLDPGGYLEDLGAILEVLGPMVITI